MRRDIPEHHDPAGGFRNPWPTAATAEPGGFLRWQRERRANGVAPNPPSGALPQSEPQFAGELDERLHVTWIGHATFLLQIAGINILTDPHWSRRASPLRFAGPARFTPPGVDWDRLPPIDLVLISHDHYDHLDSRTVCELRRRFDDRVVWYTPLGYRGWFARRRISRVVEMDWWDSATVTTPTGPLRVTALPCQHWTSRTPWDRARRLWASWALIAPDGTRIYFGGDSGYFPGYPEIGRRTGPFDVVLLPIGAYEPRWFMRPVHMNPEEAVQAYIDLGATGTMFGMHWGTWRLTDEDPLEPPTRTRRAWERAGLPEMSLHILPHGGTWIRGNS